MAPVAALPRQLRALLLFPLAGSAMKLSDLRLRSDDATAPQGNLTTPERFGAAAARPLNGRFKDVTLVLTGVTPERMDFLEQGYQPFFDDIVHVMWVKDGESPSLSLVRSNSEEELEVDVNFDEEVSAGQADPYSSKSFAMPKLHNGHAVFTCPKTYRQDYQSWCLGEILQYVAKRNEHSRGAFVSDADFWFDPVEIARGEPGLKLGALWQLGPGLKVGRWGKMGPKCYSTFSEIQNDEEWPLGRRNQDAVWNGAMLAHQGMGYRRHRNEVDLRSEHGESVAEKPVGKPEVCIGWTDAYYLPRGSFERLVKMLPYFKGVVHQAAIPTLLNYLQKFEKFSSHVDGRCWGGCCFPPAMDPSVFRKNICGHRMALKLANIQEGWITMMWNATLKMAQNA